MLNNKYPYQSTTFRIIDVVRIVLGKKGVLNEKR